MWNLVAKPHTLKYRTTEMTVKCLSINPGEQQPASWDPLIRGCCMYDTSRQYSAGIAEKNPIHFRWMNPFLWRAELLHHYIQTCSVHLIAETRLEAPCAKCCSKPINASSSCCKMQERWQLGGSISALRIKTKAVEMGCISLLQEWEAACSWLSQNLWEGLMMNNWRLLLHSLMSALPASSCPSREQVAENRDFAPC